MPNIKFSYLYRDAANYKKYNHVIFANPDDVELSKIEQLVKTKLIYGEWLYVDEWQLPDLHFGTWDNQLDHTFHEFENVEFTEEPVNMTSDLVELITSIKKVV